MRDPLTPVNAGRVRSLRRRAQKLAETEARMVAEWRAGRCATDAANAELVRAERLAVERELDRAEGPRRCQLTRELF